MIERRPFGRTGHLSTVTLFGARRAGPGQPGRGRPHAGGPAPLRRQPHRHRRALRRLRAAHRAVDGAAPEGLLPGDQDRAADGARGARGPPPLARAAPGRPRRPDPDALARPSRRLGSGDGTRRRARGAGRGANPGTDALHRRHRPRLDDRGHAPAQPGPLRLRLGPAALQLLHGPGTSATASAFEEVLAIAGERRVAVQIIKSHRARARGPPPSGRTPPGISRSKAQADIDRGGALGARPLPDVFLNTAGDLALLPKHPRRGEPIHRAAAGRGRWARCRPPPG